MRLAACDLPRHPLFSTAASLNKQGVEHAAMIYEEEWAKPPVIERDRKSLNRPATVNKPLVQLDRAPTLADWEEVHRDDGHSALSPPRSFLRPTIITLKGCSPPSGAP